MVATRHPGDRVLDPVVALVIVAAGTGRRLGAPVHKALVELAGAPLVEHTLRRLLGDGAPAWRDVVLVVHPDDEADMAAVTARLDHPVRLVHGGARRQDSVQRGVQACADDTDVVLVHDAARPFAPVAALPELAREAAAHGCALLAVPVADTIKRCADDDPARCVGTVPRDVLRAAQTPQAFRRAELLHQLEAAAAEGREVTDEAALFEEPGRGPRFVEGSPLNWKVTTPDDLELAGLLLSRQGRGG